MLYHGTAQSLSLLAMRVYFVGCLVALLFSAALLLLAAFDQYPTTPPVLGVQRHNPLIFGPWLLCVTLSRG